MTRFVSLFVVVVLLVATSAFAQVPQTMSYQGVLTNGAGAIVPDGLYDVTFRLYTVPVAGVPIWTEAHTGVNRVAVSRGGFSVILGSLTPLSLAFDGQYYLGIQLGADPELSPRVPLASSPYALALRLPFYATANGSAHNLTGNNFGGFGGTIDARSDAGDYVWALEADSNGEGGWFFVTRGGYSSGFVVDGNSAGTGDPVVGVFGSARSAIFDMTTPGDASITLPPSSISSGEILDEPGVAQGHVNGSVNIPTGATMGDIVTVSITTPDAGYIVVDADGQHGVAGDASSNYNYAALQIDEAAGGGVDGNHYFDSGFSNGPRDFFTWTPVSIHRTYFKAAGTYTFRLEGSATQPALLSNYLWNPTITARFYPTAYGGVATAPGLADAGQFTERQLTSSAGNGPGQPGVQGELVDLRELEVRAAQADAAAQKAHRDLLEAQLGAQASARERATAAAAAEKK